MIILISVHMLFNHRFGRAPSLGNHIHGPPAASSPTHRWLAPDLGQACSSPRHHAVRSDQSQRVRGTEPDCTAVHTALPDAVWAPTSGALCQVRWQTHMSRWLFQRWDCVFIFHFAKRNKTIDRTESGAIWKSANTCDSEVITFFSEGKINRLETTTNTKSCLPPHPHWPSVRTHTVQSSCVQIHTAVPHSSEDTQSSKDRYVLLDVGKMFTEWRTRL